MTAAYDQRNPTLRSWGNARPAYIHELADWPQFQWHDAPIAKSLAKASRRLEKLSDRAAGLEPAAADEITVQNLTQSAVASSNIEGEFPNRHVLRWAIASYIAGQYQPPGRNAPGIAAVTADTAISHTTPLTQDRLHQWHHWLFRIPTPGITAGRFRDDRFGLMGHAPTVHCVAPAADRLQPELDRFLARFNAPITPDDLRKPALAHLWFVTLHPYDDGNGRIAEPSRTWPSPSRRTHEEGSTILGFPQRKFASRRSTRSTSRCNDFPPSRLTPSTAGHVIPEAQSNSTGTRRRLTNARVFSDQTPYAL